MSTRIESTTKAYRPHSLRSDRAKASNVAAQSRQSRILKRAFETFKGEKKKIAKEKFHFFLFIVILFLTFKFEQDVTIFMSGLLCIISLLPIIPTSISTFLQDLFEIFNHLASWTFHPMNLKECELIHLQYGFYMLFNRLYGMYPCNFVDFLRNEYINKPEKTAIFNHTIRPFLDTVRIHPNLLISSKTNETNNARFKKMEPHDVVVECAKYSIESDKPPPASNFLDYPIYRSPMKPMEHTHLMVELPPLPAQMALVSAKSVENKFESLWSPSVVVLATPPPSSTVPNTPTPTPVPMQPNFSISISNTNQQQSHGTESSSPPQLIEAAIEATPETTPMKPELKSTFRSYPSNSQTARNIWPKSSGVGNTSSPSSPMKKDTQQFQYSADPLIGLDLTGNQKFFRILTDRNAAEPMQISREDQEVNDINSHNTSGEGNGHEMTDVMMDYDDTPGTEDEDEEDADTTPPLCNPGFYQCVDYVRRVKRLRMYSHCIYSAGTSPADTTSYMPRASSSHRLKRYNSWPNLKTSDVVIDSTKSKELNGSQQQQPSSSPSDEAISAVSHFKKNDQNGNSTKSKQNDSNLYKKIREDLKAKPLEIVQKVSKGTSTIGQWPGFLSAYDTLFNDSIFSDEMKRKQSEDAVTVTTMMTTTTTSTSVAVSKPQRSSFQPQQSLSPNEMLDQYIQVSLKRKNSNDYRDHIELLALQLQFEKHRREIHAERNRRLLGKSRQIRGLEQSNATMSDQVTRLSSEIANLNKKATETRNLHQIQIQKCQEDIKLLAKKCNEEVEKNKQLQREKESLQLRLEDERILIRQSQHKNDDLTAEIFDLQHLLEAANEEAQRGRDYRQQLVKLESEMIIFNDARIKCQQKMEELNAMKARDAEMDFLVESYSRDYNETKRTLDLKASQVDGYRARVYDLEQQVMKKDIAFAEQKRLITSIKDVHEEKFRVRILERKF